MIADKNPTRRRIRRNNTVNVGRESIVFSKYRRDSLRVDTAGQSLCFVVHCERRERFALVLFEIREQKVCEGFFVKGLALLRLN